MRTISDNQSLQQTRDAAPDALAAGTNIAEHPIARNVGGPNRRAKFGPLRTRPERSRMRYLVAGGSNTASITCTMPFDARIEATMLASLTFTLPSTTRIVTFLPFAIASC